MRLVFRFLKATIVGGLLFMVPLILMLVVLRQGLDFAKKVIGPLTARLPVRTVGGVAVVTLAAVALLLVIAVAAGMFAQTATGRKVREWLEATIVGKIPGYSIVKGILGGAGLEEKTAATVALAWIEESWVYAFVMEIHEDGHRTVFVPGAPSPLSGAIYFLPANRVRALEAGMPAVLKAIRGLGVGSAQLVRGQLGDPDQEGPHAGEARPDASPETRRP